MKFKKYASKKVITIVLITILSIGGFANQQRKIKNLQEELYTYKNAIEQRYDYTRTTIDVDSLKEEFNKLCEYKILDGKVNIKHSYIHQRDSILGLKSKFKLVGTADFYYELCVNLQNAEIIKASDNYIIVKIDKPTINEKVCHRVANSFVRMDDECSDNLLSNKEDAEKTTRYWEDTFEKKSIEYIKEYYSYCDVQNDVEDITVNSIKALLEELGYSQSLEVLVR